MASTMPVGGRRPGTRSPRSASKKKEPRQTVATKSGLGGASSAIGGSGSGAAPRSMAKKQPRALGRNGRKPSIYFDQTISKTTDLTPQVNKDIKACSMRAQPFFDRTVKWVVTRRKDYAKFVVRHSQLETQDAASPAAFLFSSGRALAGSEYNLGSPAEFGGPNTPINRGVGSTRSKTMVHKASLQATSQASGNAGQDELALAQKLGIKVMSFFEFRKWLSENVPSRKQQHPGSSAPAVTAGSKGRPPGKSVHSNLVPLRDEFIKIEDTSGRYRPIIKEVLKNSRGEYLFPKLNLDAAGSRCPFLPVKSSKSKPSASKSRSDRRSKRPQRRRELKGHCSNCGVNFKEGIEKHCATSEHRRFAENDQHFNKIDQFLMSRRLDLDTFVSKYIVEAKMEARQEAKKAEAGALEANQGGAQILADAPARASNRSAAPIKSNVGDSSSAHKFNAMACALTVTEEKRARQAPAASAPMVAARGACSTATSRRTSEPAFLGTTIDTSLVRLKSVAKARPSGGSGDKAFLPASALPGSATSTGQATGKRSRAPSGADESEIVRVHRPSADGEAAGGGPRKAAAAGFNLNLPATVTSDQSPAPQRSKCTRVVATQRTKRSPSAAAGAAFATQARSPSPPLPSSFIFDQASDAEVSATSGPAHPSRPALGPTAGTPLAAPHPGGRGSAHAITISPAWGAVNPLRSAPKADGTAAMPDTKVASKAGLTAGLGIWSSHRAIKNRAKSKNNMSTHMRAAADELEQDGTQCESPATTPPSAKRSSATEGQGEVAPAAHTVPKPRLGAFEMFKKPTGRVSTAAASTSSRSHLACKPAPAAADTALIAVGMAAPNQRRTMSLTQKRAAPPGSATGPDRTSKVGRVASKLARSAPTADSGEPRGQKSCAAKRNIPGNISGPTRSSPAATTRGRSRASYRPLTIEAPPPRPEETPMSYNLYPARVVKVLPNNRIHVMYADNDPEEGCEIPRSWAQKWHKSKVKPKGGTKMPKCNHDTDLKVGDHVGALVPEQSTPPEHPESPATTTTTNALNALSPNDDDATEIAGWDAGVNSSPGVGSSATASQDARSNTPTKTGGSRRKLDYGNDDGARANPSSAGLRHRSNKRRKLDETPNPTTRGVFTDQVARPVLPSLVEDIDQPVLLPSRRRTSSEITSPPSPDTVPRPKARKKGGTFSPARRSGGGSATKRQPQKTGMPSRAPADPYMFI